MPDDPLRTAEIRIYGAAESAAPIRVVGLSAGESVDVAPGEAVIFLAMEDPQAKSTIFLPPPVGPPIRAAVELTEPVRLSERELASLAPGEPVIITTRSLVLDVQSLGPLAEQAAAAGRSLFVVATTPDRE